MKIKLGRKQWEGIGKEAGWMKESISVDTKNYNNPHPAYLNLKKSLENYIEEADAFLKNGLNNRSSIIDTVMRERGWDTKRAEDILNYVLSNEGNILEKCINFRDELNQLDASMPKD